MPLEPNSLAIGVVIGLALAVARHLINGRTKRPAKAATFPEGYIPAEGLVPTVSATYDRLLAYAITKGCKQGIPPDRDGDTSFIWPSDSLQFKNYIGTCDNRPDAPAILEIGVYADMTVQDEQRAIRAIDQLDNALNEAAVFWFKNDQPDRRRLNGTMYFNTRVGDDYLDFSFIGEVYKRTERLRKVEAIRVGNARRAAAENQPRTDML